MRILIATLAVVTLTVAAAGYLRIREPQPPSRLEAFDTRPLPPEAADRAGVSVPPGDLGLPIESTGARWYFNWTHVPERDLSLEHVPLACGYPGNQRISQERLDELQDYLKRHSDQYPDGTLWVIGNEIGYRPQQDGREPEEYARDFRACYDIIKSTNPTFQVSVGPAILSDHPYLKDEHVGGEGGINYLTRVIKAYESLYEEPIPADYFAATAHILGSEASPAALLLRPGRHWSEDFAVEEFQDQVIRFRRLLAAKGYRDRPVIITEMGVGLGRPDPKHIASFMARTMHFLATATDDQIGNPADGGRLVQRWAWFTAHPVTTRQKLRHLGFGALVINIAQTSLLNRDGELTYLGHVHADLLGVEKLEEETR